MIKQKRGMSGLVWALIVVILLAIGVVAYIYFSGDASSVVDAGINGGSSIPQPPALPTG